MFPTLITIGDYPIHWYPGPDVLGIVLGGWMVLRGGVSQGYDRAMLFDMCWWLVVGGLVGARVTFIIVDFESQYYAACFDLAAYNETYPNNPLTEPDCGRILRWWNGGLVYYGSIIGGMLTLVWFLRKEGLKLLPIADIIVPTLALGQFFGRIGCLSAGCCWGRLHRLEAFNFPEARPCSFSTTNNISSMPLPLTRRMSILLRSTTAFADLYSSSSSYGYRSARRGMDNRFFGGSFSTQSVDLLLNYFEVMTWREVLSSNGSWSH